MTLEPSDESSEHFLGVSMGRLLKAYSASNVKRASSGERDKPEVDNAYSCEAQPLDDGYGGDGCLVCGNCLEELLGVVEDANGTVV